jgi:predicted metal-dependent HD superfamily phosphohydrolase
VDSAAALSWVVAVDQFGGSADAAAAAAAELERRYREPHRRYHTLGHIEAVLADCARLAGEVGLSTAECAVVDLAACAHDIVYRAEPGADERASAAWATEQLAACEIPSDVADKVASTVLATISHTSDDPAGQVMLDADLAILAARPVLYARYVDAVRAEYSALSDDEWRTGRAAVLGQLLDRPAIYSTEPAARWWDERARSNLTAELAALVG